MRDVDGGGGKGGFVLLGPDVPCILLDGVMTSCDYESDESFFYFAFFLIAQRRRFFWAWDR